MVDLLTPVLTKNWGDERAWKLTNYERTGGYAALREALEMSPADVVTAVKDSGLRGRGGAGFPTGMKWGFIPQDNPKPTYLVVNADESEPGTCKDIPLMMASPHTLVEGVTAAGPSLLGLNIARERGWSAPPPQPEPDDGAESDEAGDEGQKEKQDG